MDDSQQFYRNPTKYADQDRVNSILQQYESNVGRGPSDVARFERYYNDPNYYQNAGKIGSELSSTAAGKKWLNPSTASAARSLTRNTLSNPVDIYNQALEKLGIADARTRVQEYRTQMDNTANLLNNLESNITGRTSGSLVTEAQRQKLLASERAPLTGSLNTINTAFGNAQQDMESILGQAGTQTDLAWEGEQSQRQALIQRLEEAIRRSSSKLEQKKFKKQLDLEKKKFKESTRQFNLNYKLAKSK